MEGAQVTSTPCTPAKAHISKCAHMSYTWWSIMDEVKTTISFIKRDSPLLGKLDSLGSICLEQVFKLGGFNYFLTMNFMCLMQSFQILKVVDTLSYQHILLMKLFLL